MTLPTLAKNKPTSKHKFSVLSLRATKEDSDYGQIRDGASFLTVTSNRARVREIKPAVDAAGS